MRTLVIGTAGHIDHGKSALVKALTGTDPDRLKEEQARGITIDLGFAHTEIGDVSVSFVDVPGHERFVRNMLAGAGGLDAIMLVVAADESVMPQTREHFEICRLLDIGRGLIVITKADLVEPDTLELVELEVRDLVAGSFLDGGPVLRVSARTGAGLADLRAALAVAADEPSRVQRAGIVRLPVDRVFSVRGFGTVVTGTLVSGRIGVGDDVVVLPGRRQSRVRGLQVHGRSVPDVEAPSRAAVNLGTVEAGDLTRGATLASEGTLAVTRRVDVRLSLVAGARALRHGARVRVHHGTSETLGRVSVAAVRVNDEWVPARPGEPGVALAGGGEAFARLRLDRPVAATRGDRMVLRAASPPATIGGAVVLDPEPTSGGVRRAAALDRFRSLAGEDQVADVWLVEAAGRGLRPADLVRRGGLGHQAAAAALDGLARQGRAVRAPDAVFDAVWVAGVEAAVVRSLEAFHRAEPREAGRPREALRDEVARGASPVAWELVVARLRAAGTIKGTDRIGLSTHDVSSTLEEERQRQAVLDAVVRAGLTLPDLAGLARETGLAPEVAGRRVHELSKAGAIVKLGELAADAAALERLKDEVKGLKPAGATSATTIDVGTFKARYGLSRKHAIPLLEWLDRERVTRRTGDVRIVL